MGISYDEDVLRLIDIFQGMDLYVGSVVITRYSGQPAADAFLKRLNHVIPQLLEHTDFAVRLEARQDPGGVEIIEELPAEFQIQLPAELADPLPDAGGLGLNVLTPNSALQRTTDTGMM